MNFRIFGCWEPHACVRAYDLYLSSDQIRWPECEYQAKLIRRAVFLWLEKNFEFKRALLRANSFNLVCSIWKIRQNPLLSSRDQKRQMVKETFRKKGVPRALLDTNLVLNRMMSSHFSCKSYCNSPLAWITKQIWRVECIISSCNLTCSWKISVVI
jgi:hypothetical protein